MKPVSAGDSQALLSSVDGVPDSCVGTPKGLQAATPPSEASGQAYVPLDSFGPGPARSVVESVFHGGGLPDSLLAYHLGKIHATLEALAAGELPETPVQLVDSYARLGRAVAMAEACLISSLDALDSRTGGGVARPARPYLKLKASAFEALRSAGRLFDKLEPAFARLVHGPKAWPKQRVELGPDRGDGRPYYLYRNTWKKTTVLSRAQQEAELAERVTRFTSRGGSFGDIIVAEPGSLDQLIDKVHYDYVISADQVLRLSSLEQEVKPGHSLLATGGPDFDERPVLAAGELWVLRDSAGDLEVLVLANNSGHFKPDYEDLYNAVPLIERLGVAREKLVLYGGPNNLPSMMAEISQKYPQLDVASALPPPTSECLASLAAGQAPHEIFQ